jgi:hypothetical protein
MGRRQSGASLRNQRRKASNPWRSLATVMVVPVWSLACYRTTSSVALLMSMPT